MKLLIKISGVCVALIGLLVIISFFLPHRFHVERAIEIKAPAAVVFPYVADLNNWKRWGIWYERDPAMTVTTSAVSSAVGSSTEWQSKSEGSGRATLTALDAPKHVGYRLEFKEFQMVSEGSYSVTPNPDGKSTTVLMAIDGDLKANPVMRWMGLFMDKLAGPDYEAGLAKLKILAEKS